MGDFHAYKTREVPVHKRDMATLKDTYTKLVEQAAKKKKRGAAVPPEMTFELLEVEWAELVRESDECEVAMEKHMERWV